MKLNALIISPVLPQSSGQGNRARVYDISKQLSYFADLHLLYYLYETVNETEYTFEKFEGLREIYKLILPVVPTVDIQPIPLNKRFHSLDEWWDPILNATLKYLANNFKYDFILVNYVWLSKAFEFFPNSVIKLLDTHDVFTERDNIYKDLGVKPEFYYTSEENETRGLNRADIVLGIQDKDTNYFKKISKSYCLTLPHLSTVNIYNNPTSQSTFKIFKIGLLGVANKINILSFKKFIELFEARNIDGVFKILVAGSVCDHLNDSKNLIKLGFVENLNDFFTQIDLFINPVDQSSGQKIKLADAISYEIPFISTKNGSEGLPIQNDNHEILNITSLVDKFYKLRIDENFISKLKNSTVELKTRIEDIRKNAFKTIRQSIISIRKLTVLYFSGKNDFFHSELVFERTVALKAALSGSSIVKIVVSDDEFFSYNAKANVFSLTDFINSEDTVVIDTLINMGPGIKKLDNIARRIVYDVVSNTSKYGTFDINDLNIYAHNRKLIANKSFIDLPLDMKFNYAKLNKKNSYKVYIVVSNYYDIIPREMKKIIQKNASCEIILPHHIKNYKSIDRYTSLLESSVGFIFMDSTDIRFDILKELIVKSKIPCFFIDKYLNSSSTSISSRTFFSLVYQLPAILKRNMNSSLTFESYQNFWDKSPNLWTFIRA